MPEISNLTRPKVVQTTIDLGDGDTVLIAFDRNKVTPHWASEAARRDGESDPLSMPKALADVITDWDVTNDGQPFPPTFDNLAVFTYAAQTKLLEKILEASSPSESEGKASASPSPIPSSDSEAPPPTFPNGAATSTLAGHSASQSQT